MISISFSIFNVSLDIYSRSLVDNTYLGLYFNLLWQSYVFELVYLDDSHLKLLLI